MITDKREAHEERTSTNNATRSSSDAGPKQLENPRVLVFARRARAFMAEFPGILEAQVKRNPTRALGIAGAAGLGLGIVFGSRILRAAAMSAASAVVVELGRTYLLREVQEGLGVDHHKPATKSS